MAKALPAHQKQEGLFVCRASSRPHGGGRLLSAAAIAAVAAAAIVVAVKAEPVAAAAAQQDKDDDEPSAVTVTHGRVPPFELHSILWWAAESVTAAAFDFPPFLKKLIS